ncbi:hypothetical protein V5O48_000682 [Marasmius crinis-equi]|uniref:3-hydroxyisobutyrate dehydrogenase n=1 Tax=Marasmius crinis-equi TaxID=585013 RepID=A0ABR3G0X8_9AGAR
MPASLPQRYGWVGLGAMGYPMANQLRQKLPQGCKLIVYDVNEDVTKQFVDENGGSIQVKVAHSTIDPESSLVVGRAVDKSSTEPDNPARFYDAPVSGGTAGAAKGALTFMVGAAPDDPFFPVLEQIFRCMGTSIYPIGGRSLGVAAKLSNNYLSSMVNLATAEAMNLGMRLGIDPKVLSNCFKTSSGSNWVNSTVNPVPGVCPDAVTSKGYEGGFKVIEHPKSREHIQLMKKDLTLAIQAANSVGAKLVLADSGLPAYTEASNDPRCKDKDSRVIYRWLGGVEPEV